MCACCERTNTRLVFRSLPPKQKKHTLVVESKTLHDARINMLAGEMLADAGVTIVQRWLQIGVLGVVAVLSGAAMEAQPPDLLPPASTSLDEAAAARFAHLALACLHKE